MKRILIYSCLCLFFGIDLKAQTQLDRKETKSFPISDSGQLIVQNRYGFIQCKIWSQDSVKIETAITVNAKDDEVAEALLNSIRIDYNVFVDMVEVKTIFGESKQNFIKNYLSKIDPFKNNKVDVNYTIYLPASVDIEIENRFGDVLMDSFTGDVDLQINYGDFRFDQISGKSEFELKYGKMVGKHLEDASLDLKNYELRIDSANEIDISSTGSEIKIETVNSGRVDLNRDEVEIEEINSIKGKATLSDIELYKVKEEIDLWMKNGSLMVEEFSDQVKKVDIREESSRIDLQIGNISFDLKAELEDAELSVPNTVDNINKEVIDEKKAHRKVSLEYGGGDTKVEFQLHGSKGKFTLID